MLRKRAPFRRRRKINARVAVATARYARMMASVADRDRAVKVLQESFAEGRLSWEEVDDRIGRALVSRDFPELAALIGDLPVSPLGRMPAHRATLRPMNEPASTLRRASPRKRASSMSHRRNHSVARCLWLAWAWRP